MGKGGDALQRAGSLAERAAASGDRVGELCGRIQEGVFRTFIEPEGATEKLVALLEQALPVFQAAGDDLALYIGYSALGTVAPMRGADGRGAGGMRAGRRARSTGGPAVRAPWVARRLLASSARRPFPELLAWLDEHEPRAVRDIVLRAYRGRGAGDARPVRRGASDPRRIACGACRARRGTLACGD